MTSIAERDPVEQQAVAVMAVGERVDAMEAHVASTGCDGSNLGANFNLDLIALFLASHQRGGVGERVKRWPSNPRDKSSIPGLVKATIGLQLISYARFRL